MEKEGLPRAAENRLPAPPSHTPSGLWAWQLRQRGHTGLQVGEGARVPASGGGLDPLSSWGAESPGLGRSFVPQSLLSRLQEGT